MKPQQKKLTTLEKVTIKVLLEKEIEETNRIKDNINSEPHEDNDKLNQMLDKEIEVYNILIEKLS